MVYGNYWSIYRFMVVNCFTITMVYGRYIYTS